MRVTGALEVGKIPVVSPELSASLIHNLYLLFTHNYILAAYLFGLLLALGLAVIRPSRFAILLIVGFAVLAFSFEYDKHIVEGLREQTLQSVVAGETHRRATKWIDVIIGELMPIVLYSFGWFLIYLAILIAGWRKRA